jgi:hypothetical protein
MRSLVILKLLKERANPLEEAEYNDNFIAPIVVAASCLYSVL